jgi:hypothetical protein
MTTYSARFPAMRVSFSMRNFLWQLAISIAATLCASVFLKAVEQHFASSSATRHIAAASPRIEANDTDSEKAITTFYPGQLGPTAYLGALSPPTGTAADVFAPPAERARDHVATKPKMVRVSHHVASPVAIPTPRPADASEAPVAATTEKPVEIFGFALPAPPSFSARAAAVESVRAGVAASVHAGVAALGDRIAHLWP